MTGLFDSYFKKCEEKEKELGIKYDENNLIDFGKKQLKKKDLGPDLVKFHKFNIEMIQMDSGIGQLGRAVVQEARGKRFGRTRATIAASKFSTVAAMNLKGFAKQTATDLKIIKNPKAVKKAAVDEQKQYEKYTIEDFYYETGKRYLKFLGWRI